MDDEIPTPSDEEVFGDEDSESSEASGGEDEGTISPPPLDDPEAQQEKGV